jgi:hypothetical protein
MAEQVIIIIPTIREDLSALPNTHFLLPTCPNTHFLFLALPPVPELLPIRLCGSTTSTAYFGIRRPLQAFYQ